MLLMKVQRDQNVSMIKKNGDAEQEQCAGYSFLKTEVILSNAAASEIIGCVNISFEINIYLISITYV